MITIFICSVLSFVVIRFYEYHLSNVARSFAGNNFVRSSDLNVTSKNSENALNQPN